jgi:hypothetical protein
VSVSNAQPQLSAFIRQGLAPLVGGPEVRAVSHCTNGWSVDSLDARLNSSDLGYYLDHPGTATQTDIFTAQDVLRNYE